MFTGVDNEKDIVIYRGSEYFSKYDNGDITKEQYVLFGGGL